MALSKCQLCGERDIPLIPCKCFACADCARSNRLMDRTGRVIV